MVDDVQRFAAAAEAADMSLLEIAWAVASEEPRSYSLAELAQLLFDDNKALPQYVTFCMLLHDEIYFKPVSPCDSPDPEAKQLSHPCRLCCSSDQ